MRGGAVRFDGVGHSYGSAARVLADVDLTVEAGEVLLVHGRNGAGKTTLLRIAAGALRPRSGHVERQGRTGYLPQRSEEPPPRLSPHSWLRAVAGMRGTVGDDWVDILRALGVDWATAALDTLSVGTLAKVMIAGAFGGTPDVLVLDEPFSALDSTAREMTLNLIEAAAGDGAAVLVSDHDGAAVGIATHVATIESGQLIVKAAAAPTPTVRVVGADGSGAPVDLVVPASDADALLLRLLTDGGTIRRVEQVS